MKVKEIKDISKIGYQKISDLNNTIESNKSKAYNNLLDDIIKDTDEYVPYKSGALSRSVTKVSDGIEYRKPYASYIFSGVSRSGKPLKYNTSTHNKATSHPVQRALDENIERYTKKYAKYLLGGD